MTTQMERPTATVPPTRMPTLAQRDARAGRVLLAPTLVVVLLVVVVPIVWTVVLSFQDLRLIDLRRRGLWGGFTLENLAGVFTSRGFYGALGTTLLYSVVGTVTSIGIGLVAALALRRRFRGRTVARAFMLLPYVAPVVAVTFVWQTMLNPQFGIVNEIGTNVFGWADPVAFLTQRSADVSVFGLEFSVPVALLTVMAFEAWRYFPFAFLFLTARLAAVPGELEEAARVDGATPTQRFRHVIWPQLLPVIALLAVLRFIFTFNEFDDIYLLTGGGAGTQVVSVRVYELLTARGDVGAASAQALVLSLVLVVLLAIYFRFWGRKVEQS
ncbi:carbohydrate ABC transporter permease [Pseudonocardia sp. TRM90224]|uniref:carbohydrate ABC transporter permease n=1 Tax=Pseudonocardia sp. TRM90224 TaxID=2812678 RepID=UPI001E344FBD|nr:sugar ABC transporter permease [Pseudonocardia sp. TRM90224]